jgi:hypothetical protein
MKPVRRCWIIKEVQMFNICLARVKAIFFVFEMQVQANRFQSFVLLFVFLEVVQRAEGCAKMSVPGTAG